VIFGFPRQSNFAAERSLILFKNNIYNHYILCIRHVINTNDLESFVVLADAPLMSGIRRITCATNSGASEAMEHGQELQCLVSSVFS
jgi:hypothetical protein